MVYVLDVVQVFQGVDELFHPDMGLPLVLVVHLGDPAVALLAVQRLDVLLSVQANGVGAHLALIYSDRLLSYLLLAALPFLTVLVLVPRRKKDVAGRCSRGVLLILSSLLALLTGLYDGFFGPGTGMFLTIGFSMLGFQLLESAGIARVINAASNVAALCTFIASGSVIYAIGIPAALFSIAGNALGSRFAVRHGDRAIKPLLITVIAILYLKIVISLL